MISKDHFPHFFLFLFGAGSITRVPHKPEFQYPISKISYTAIMHVEVPIKPLQNMGSGPSNLT
jgi:hypothetical protein